MKRMEKYGSTIKVKVVIISSFLSMFFSAACSENIINFNNYTNNYTSKDNVSIRKEAIKKDYNFGKKMDMVFGVTATGLCAVITYKLVKYFLAKPDSKKIKCLSNRELTEKLLALELSFDKHKDPKMLGKRWFRNLSKSMITSFISSSVAGVGLKMFDKFYKRYHCFDNLADFIDVRSSGLIALDELLYNAQLYDHHLNNNNKLTDLQASKDRFIITLRNLVANMEGIVAFMEHKVDSLEYVVLAQEDILISSYLYDSLDRYCSKATSILDGNSQERLFVMSTEFKDDAQRFIESFKGLEGRIDWLN